MEAADFFSLVRRVVGFSKYEAIADPLEAAVSQISSNPAFAQSRLLRRVLVALVTGGEFRRAEAAGLDAPTCRLVIALVDLRVTGVPGQQAWLDALTVAERVAD